MISIRHRRCRRHRTLIRFSYYGGVAGGRLRRGFFRASCEGQAMLSDNEMRDVLMHARTIAVVGLSDNPNRDSYAVAGFLQRNGYRILPVNPNLRGPVLGEQPYASLRDIRERIDIVDVFRRPEHLPQVVDDAIASGADCLWTQLGVIDLAAARRAQAAGLKVVHNHCIAIEHRRLMREVETVLY
jgi:uncharacterized protein